MDASEERKRIYASTRADLLARNLSNSEKYDNAILTLSTGFLGISLAFIKDIVPLDKLQSAILLEVSWILFGLSIVSTLISFSLSQLAIKRQLDYAEKYYLEEKNEYLNKKNSPAFWTDLFNCASGLLFILGIVTTICFVSLNTEGGHPMAKDFQHRTTDGAPVPSLQKIQASAEKKGASIPSMQPIGPSTSNTQQSGSQSNQSGGNTGKTKQ